MHKNVIIKLTNRISLISIFLLLYWVFIFITITVFGLKIFRENITEMFYFSIIGILALLSGSVIVNLMFNLTKISEVLSGEYVQEKEKSEKKYIKISLIISSFLIIIILLFLGDYRSSKSKENYLLESAEYIIKNNQKMINDFISFSFDSTYLAKAQSNLTHLSKINESFPSVSIIHQLDINEKKEYISITRYSYLSKHLDPVNFIFSCSVKERNYLDSVFKEKNTEHLFSAFDGKYELYYPVIHNGNIFILYFHQSHRYGKIGS